MDDSLWSFTPDEFVKASGLRAVEWGKWPIFISQPLYPVLLAFGHPELITSAILICSWIWCLVRYRFVSYRLARVGVFWVRVKWLTIPTMALYFGMHQEWLLMSLAILTPVIAAVLGFFVPPTQIGIVQKLIWAKVGFNEESAERMAGYRKIVSDMDGKRGQTEMDMMAAILGEDHNQADLTPDLEFSTLIYVNPDFAIDLHDWNCSDIPAKRVILDPKNKIVKLAHTDAYIQGFQFTSTASDAHYFTEPADGLVSLELWKTNGTRTARGPNHFLDFELDFDMP